MKKLIAILVVFAVVAGAAFAQVPEGMFMNAWGRINFSPLMMKSTDFAYGKKVEDTNGAISYVAVGPSWGWGHESGGGISVGGSGESIGFNMAIEFDGNSIFGNVWAKPFNGSDAFKITAGRYAEDTLASSVYGKNWFSNYVLPGTWEWDVIFSRMGSQGGESKTHYAGDANEVGFMFTSVPVNGLFIGWNVNIGNDAVMSPLGEMGDLRRANDAFRASQIGVGYNIENIGHVRAMYLGGWAGTIDTDNDKHMKKVDRAAYKPSLTSGTIAENDQSSVQVGFALTALENIAIDIGYRGWIPITIAYKGDKFVKSSNGHWLGAAVNMSFGIFNLNIFGASKFGSYTRELGDALDSRPYSKDKNRNATEFQLRLTPSLDLDFGTIGLAIGYNYISTPISYTSDEKWGREKDKSDADYSHQIGLGIFYERGLGNGSFSIGVSYTMPPLTPMFEDGDYKKAAFNGNHWIQIPIALTYAFF